MPAGFVSRAARHAVLAATIPLAVATMVRAQAPARGPAGPVVRWSPHLTLGHVYPSIALMTASLDAIGGRPRMVVDGDIAGDRLGMIGVVVQVAESTHVRVEIEGARHIGRSAIEATVAAGRPTRLLPRVRYRHDELFGLEEPVDEPITFRVVVDGVVAGEATRAVRIRPANEYPLAYIDEAGARQNWVWSLAGAVNENDPMVERILRDAYEAGTMPAFTGYAGGSRLVAQQALAVWDALERRGMRIDRAASDPEMAGKARLIRTPTEAVMARSMDCTEGSVLLASVFRRLGIDPVLLVTPEHILVGFYTDRERQSLALIDPRELRGAQAPSRTWKGSARAPGAMSETMSTRSFRDAVRAGESAYDGAATFLEHGTSGYELIDIAAARGAGLTPVRGRIHALLR